MKHNPIRLLLFFLTLVSLPTLACGMFAPKEDTLTVTLTAAANLVSTSLANGESIEQTAAALVTQAGQDPFILTAEAYATQVATAGAFNVTPPDYVQSALPPGFGGAPENIPIIGGASDVQIIPGVILYTSPSTVEATKQFYLEQMPKLGWTYDAGQTFENSFSVTLHFHNDTQSIQIMINSATGQVKVNMTYTR